ncbi:MAG TPA: hypothetical protein VMW72_11435 [Sedimentisphaerales bacterium]|nr:hypothetical protein [Sedimentisphaerales bacterium]
MNSEINIKVLTKQRAITILNSLFDKFFGEQDELVKVELAKLLPGLANIDQTKALHFYEIGLYDESMLVRTQVAKTLGVIAEIKPIKFIELYEKALTDEDFSVKQAVASQLKYIAKLRPSKFIHFFQSALTFKYGKDIRPTIVGTLDALIHAGPKRFRSQFWELFERSIKDDYSKVREKAFGCLDDIVSFYNDMAIKFYKQGLNDPDEYVRLEVTNRIAALRRKHPEKALELYEVIKKDKSKKVREAAQNHLRGVHADKFVLYDDKGQIFIEERKESNDENKLTYNELIGSTQISSEYEEYIRGIRKSKRNISNMSSKQKVELYKLREHFKSFFPRYGLDWLLFLDKDKFRKEFLIGLQDPNGYNRMRVAKELALLIDVDLKDYIDLYNNGIVEEDPFIRDGISWTLGVLSRINPDTAIELFEEGLHHPKAYVRVEVAYRIQAIASVNVDQFLKFLRKALENSYERVRACAASQFKIIPCVAPEKFFEFYELGLAAPDDGTKFKAAWALASYVHTTKEAVFGRYEKGLSNEDLPIRAGTTLALAPLATLNIEEYLRFYSKVIADVDPMVRECATNTLAGLIEIDLFKYVELVVLSNIIKVM